jgi:WXG100 family type VII secretion target
MANISIGHQELQQAAADVRNRKGELQQFLRQAASAVEQVTGRAYRTRTASREFRNAHDEWNQATGELINRLEEVARAIDETRQRDEQTDRDAAGRVGNIRGNRGGGSSGAVVGAGVAGGAAAASAVAARSRASAAGTGGATGGGGGGAGGGGGGGGSGGGRGAAGGGSGGGRQARDPVYSMVPQGQARPGEQIAQRSWGQRHADGARYAYDRVPGRDGELITRPQGVQVRVTKDMLPPPPRTTSPPGALKAVMPGYDNRYRLEQGHVWADRLGGPNAARNFVPVHAYANGNRGMAYVEARVAEAVNRYGQVDLVVLPRYVGNEPIPRDIFYAWKVPGRDWTAMKIDNLP